MAEETDGGGGKDLNVDLEGPFVGDACDGPSLFAAPVSLFESLLEAYGRWMAVNNTRNRDALEVAMEALLEPYLLDKYGSNNAWHVWRNKVPFYD